MCSVEYLKYYLFGKPFTVITDHRAVLSIVKDHRSNKCYNSRLTRWVDRLLAFDFKIEHIPGAKMGLVDFISRQPNQEAKVTNKYAEEFAVATITRIRDAIAAIYINTTPQNCQYQHFSSVSHTHSTRASNSHPLNHSNLLSALKRHQIWMCLRCRTCGNSKLNTGCSTWVSPPHTPRQLGYDYPRTICFRERFSRMHREILNKSAQCKPSTEIRKNLKPVAPSSNWKPLLNCSEPNEEIQLDFGCPITSEKDQDIHFIACFDRFSKYPRVEVLEKANGPNVIKFLDEYIFKYTVSPEILD